MTNISIQELQNIAVRATTDFFNGTSLNESLAKQASELDLNSDQLKRAIEATNTLTFLKSAEVSKDKTVEFPVADYNEILKLACVPEGAITKTACKIETVEDLDNAITSLESLVKSAEEALKPEMPVFTPDQLKAQIYKSAQINKRAISDLEIKVARSADRFLKLASELQALPDGLELLSASSADDVTFTKLASLIYPANGGRKDYAKFLYKSAQLNLCESMIQTYKELSDEHKELGLRKEAQDKVLELEKAGFFLTSAAKGVWNFAKNPAAMTGKGIGKAVGGTVKTLGRGVANTVGGVGKIIKNKTQNAMAGTDLGKKLGMPKVEMPVNIKRNLAIGATVGGAVIDAASYTPKVDPMNGRMGDVWDSLRK